MHKTDRISRLSDKLPVFVVFILCILVAAFVHILVMAVCLYFGYTPLASSLMGAFLGININYVLQLEVTLKGGCYLPFSALGLLELFYLILSAGLFFLFHSVLNFEVAYSQIFTTGIIFTLIGNFFRN